MNDHSFVDAARSPAPDAPGTGRPVGEAAPVQQPVQRGGPTGWIVAGAALLIVGAVVYATAGVGDGAVPFQVATAQCDLEDTPHVRLVDGGATLHLDQAGAENLPGLHAAQLACILGELDVPTSVLVRMESERELSTWPAAQWDNTWIEWSYAPDSSMTVTLKTVEP